MNAFEVVEKQIETQLWRYLHARAALEIYESLKRLRSPNHSGRKRVHDNIRILGRYNYFFGSAEEVYRFYMFIELSKLFDPNTKASSVPNLIQMIDKNFEQYSTENHFDFRRTKGEIIDEFWIKMYKPLTRRDIGDIKRMMSSIKPVVAKLTIYRNQQLAHDDRQKQEVSISGQEVHRLFGVAEKILDKLSSRLLSSHTIRDHYLRDSRFDTKRLVKDLLKAEKVAAKGF